MNLVIPEDLRAEGTHSLGLREIRWRKPPPHRRRGARGRLPQKLMSAPACVKLEASPVPLPGVLKDAVAEQLSVAATFERLLAIEAATALTRRLIGVIQARGLVVTVSHYLTSPSNLNRS